MVGSVIAIKTTFPSGNTATVLKPSEGYKYITNGSVFSKEVILGKNDSVENWQDTNQEPPKEEEIEE